VIYVKRNDHIYLTNQGKFVHTDFQAKQEPPTKSNVNENTGLALLAKSSLRKKNANKQFHNSD